MKWLCNDLLCVWRREMFPRSTLCRGGRSESSLRLSPSLQTDHDKTMVNVVNQQSVFLSEFVWNRNFNIYFNATKDVLIF